MERPYKYNPELPAVVLGGGGAFGIGFESGVLDAIRDRGVDLSNAQMLGTSAGSWVASFMATGKEFDDVANMNQVKVPNYKPGYLRGYAREILGDARAANVSAMAVRLPDRKSPMFHPEMLNGEYNDLADIVWASSSVPGVFYPAEINGGRYIDGGLRSVVSADLAPRSHTLLAVAALGKHLISPAGPALDFHLRYELGKWKKKYGGKIIYIEPDENISNMIKSPKDIFDFELAKDVYGMAKEQTNRLIDDPQRSLGGLVLRMANQTV